MKKLKLTLSNMEGAEILTREQLKKIVGGDGSGGGSGGLAICIANCTCPPGYRPKDARATGYTITVDCTGVCGAQDNVGVTCSKNGETVSKTCASETNNLCELIPG